MKKYGDKFCNYSGIITKYNKHGKVITISLYKTYIFRC